MKVIFLFVLIFSANAAWAVLSLPHESQLPSVMLNQNEELLFQQGVIPEKGPSSLCGPTSAINWLQLEYGFLPKEQQVALLARAADQVRKAGIDVNQGLIEPQLIQYLQELDALVGVKNRYHGKGRYFGRADLTVEDLLSSEPQILLLRYDSRPQPQIPTMGRDRGPRSGRDPMIPIVDESALRGFHFVLKVAANSATQEILFIDPENPGRYSRARLEIRTNPRNQQPELRLLPKTSTDLASFYSGTGLLWTALSVIEKLP